VDHHVQEQLGFVELGFEEEHFFLGFFRYQAKLG
jgi:hypothetical protein